MYSARSIHTKNKGQSFITKGAPPSRLVSGFSLLLFPYICAQSWTAFPIFYTFFLLAAFIWNNKTKRERERERGSAFVGNGQTTKMSIYRRFVGESSSRPHLYMYIYLRYIYINNPLFSDWLSRGNRENNLVSFIFLVELVYMYLSYNFSLDLYNSLYFSVVYISMCLCVWKRQRGEWGKKESLRRLFSFKRY